MTSHLNKPSLIAETLLREIIKSELQPGSTLATEAALAERFRVSRPTLREGLRVLETHGAIELRPGPGGGIIVRQPPPDKLAQILSIFLGLRKVSFALVLEASKMLEPTLAFFAAERGSEKDFDEMAASIERMRAQDGDSAELVRENETFHSILARASGNEVLVVLWEALSVLLSRYNLKVNYSSLNKQHIERTHEIILESCRSRDPARAAATMADHWKQLETLVSRKYRYLLQEPATLDLMEKDIDDDRARNNHSLTPLYAGDDRKVCH